MRVEIAPSIMCVDFLHVAKALDILQARGIRWLHADVMDGVFAPGFTFGRDFVRAIRKAWPHAIDLHLMSARPLEHLDQFIDTGVDVISVHVEHPDYDLCIRRIGAQGIQAGIAISPSTPLQDIAKQIIAAQSVLAMGVFPGSVGAAMAADSAQRVKYIRGALDDAGHVYVPLIFDGGVSVKTIGELALAGANRFVSGSAIFHTPDIGQAIDDLRFASAPLVVQ